MTSTDDVSPLERAQLSTEAAKSVCDRAVTRSAGLWVTATGARGAVSARRVTTLLGVALAVPLALQSANASAATDPYVWWPANGTVSGACGEPRSTHTHAGTDIANALGTAVYAGFDGTIRWNAVGLDPKGYGNYLDVVHGSGWSTRYAHLLETVGGKSSVAEGTRVTRGQLLGHTAVNGDSTGPHVHFEILKDGRFRCPANAPRGARISARTSTGYGMTVPSAAPESVSNGGGTRMVGTGGYLDVSSTGQVYAWNSQYLGGSPGGYSGRFVDAAVTSGGSGYRLMTSRGQVYAYGAAPYLGGSPTGFTGDMVGLAASSDGSGYGMVSETGQVYAYGSVAYRGGSPIGYSGRFVDMKLTPSGAGYWLLTSAGQVYAYGDAQYRGGSPTGYDRAIVAFSTTSTGGGYVMVSKSGQVYAYGDAQYRGGSPNLSGAEITDISRSSDGGYVIVSSTGSHYCYGVPFLGNAQNFSGSF